MAINITPNTAGILRFVPRALVSINATLRGSTTGEPKIKDGKATDGVEVQYTLVPNSASWTSAPPGEASTCDLVFHQSALPFDPRDVLGMTVTLMAGNVRDVGPAGLDELRADRNIRFLGDVDEPEMDLEMGPVVTLKARDVSAPYREHGTHISHSAVPRYDDLVIVALQRILDSVSHAKGRIEIAPAPYPGQTLGVLIGKEGAKGPIPIDENMTPWEALEKTCKLANLIPHLRLDQLHLLTPSEAFGDPGLSDDARAAYEFIYGTEEGNCSSVKFRKKYLSNRKGIAVQCYDPVAGKVIEGLWPSDKDLLSNRVQKPRTATARHGAASQSARRQEKPARSIFPVDGIQNEKQATEYAKRLWDERAYQEAECDLESPMWDDDILSLKTGDRVLVKVRPDLEAQIRRSASPADASRYLENALGIPPQVATAMVRITRENPLRLWHTRSVNCQWYADQDPRVHVEFVNLIHIQG